MGRERGVIVGDKQIVYGCPNKTTEWRVETLPVKEPDTLRWIMEFEQGDLFMDIGANVGMYTLFAAVVRGVEVVAFEPEAGNFAQLLWNVRRNDVADLVTAYPVAISNECGFDILYMSNADVGGSCHSFGESVDFNLAPRKRVEQQGSYSTTVDAFGARPAHIKIDVDGIEHLVIEGAHDTLRSDSLKSVLVEINTNIEAHANIVAEMKELGFDCTVAPGALRSKGPFKGIGNHIFRRGR